MKPNGRGNQAKRKPGNASHDGTEEGGNEEERKIHGNREGHVDCPKFWKWRLGRTSAVTLVNGVTRPAVEGVELRHRRSKLRQVVTVHA